MGAKPTPSNRPGMHAQTPVRLVVGLGNPGPEYQRTRHNAGFWLLDRLAEALGTDFRAERRFAGEVATGSVAGRTVHLLKPMTFMNRSGQAVQAAMRFYRLVPAQVLVAHDEIDLPPGEIRLKHGGGAGGHNCLRDLIRHFGDVDFLRIRIGVGRPAAGGPAVTSHVLGAPADAERARIDHAIGAALGVMCLVLSGETQRAMQQLHTARPDEGPG